MYRNFKLGFLNQNSKGCGIVFKFLKYIRVFFLLGKKEVKFFILNNKLLPISKANKQFKSSKIEFWIKSKKKTGHKCF